MLLGRDARRLHHETGDVLAATAHLHQKTLDVTPAISSRERDAPWPLTDRDPPDDVVRRCIDDREVIRHAVRGVDEPAIR